MSIKDMIAYDKENRNDLVLKYYEYLKACCRLVEYDYDLRSITDAKSSKLKDTEMGFEVTDIFHFYYVLNIRLQATLCIDGRYRISFEQDTRDGKRFEIYEYVDEETYKSVYSSISDKNIEMTDINLI